MQSPWQLYLFCAVELLGSIMSSTWIVRDPCRPVYGDPCDDAARVLSDMNSFWLFSLAVYFFLLSFRNRNEPEKLKRLAYFAIYCTIANIVGLLMIGSTAVAGLMKTPWHVLYVALTFVLFVILASAVSSDTPMVATAPFRENLGLNLKGLMALFAVVLLAWMFANSDFQPIGTVFQEEELSEIARMCWNYWSVLVLQVLFVFIYALAYDDDGDREVLAIAAAALNFLAMIMTWTLRRMVKTGIVTFMYVQGSIFIVLAIAAVVRYRMDLRNSGGYESIST
jgi:hypothetical protein